VKAVPALSAPWIRQPSQVFQDQSMRTKHNVAPGAIYSIACRDGVSLLELIMQAFEDKVAFAALRWRQVMEVSVQFEGCA